MGYRAPPPSMDKAPADASTLPPENLTIDPPSPDDHEVGALVVLWCRDEPARAGEVILGGTALPRVFGRGEPGRGRVGLIRQRPGRNEPSGALTCARISREQLRIHTTAEGGLVLENVGRCRLVHGEREASSFAPSPGDLVELKNELLFLVVRRPLVLRAHPHGDVSSIPFGEADGAGILGESAAIWDLRGQIAAVSRLGTHVLVVGPSGSGKELVAGAIHAGSSRGSRAMVARNAATIPESLAEAELFGNLRSYPNPGTPERPGLVGEAHGTTLFLDELGELPIAVQAKLLRVLDDGEYHRLGEAGARRADIRLVGATNRPAGHVKHDVLARLKTHIRVPDLNERREDIPLLAVHLLRRHAEETPEVLAPFFAAGGRGATPRLSPALVGALVRHEYTTHVRELDALLLRAALESRGKYVDLPRGGLAPKRAAVEAKPKGEEGWTREERTRLQIQRRHGFRATECGHDPEYPGNRQTADFHLRQLMCRALALSDWNIDEAALLLVGRSGVSMQGKLVERIETFLENLRRRRARLVEEGSADPDGALAKALTEEWHAAASSVLVALSALGAGQIHRAAR